MIFVLQHRDFVSEVIELSKLGLDIVLKDSDPVSELIAFTLGAILHFIEVELGPLEGHVVLLLQPDLLIQLLLESGIFAVCLPQLP